MKGADPFRRTSLEVKILATLKDHPTLLLDLVDAINPNQKEAIVCTVMDFCEEGLATMRALDDSGQLVQLTAHGQQLLLQIYSGRTPCD